MKPTLPRERAGNELSPVIPNPLGVPNLVSVLVSVADPLTPKPLLHAQLGLEPMAGIEPATDGLRNRCSTAELHWRQKPERASSPLVQALAQRVVSYTGVKPDASGSNEQTTNVL